MDSSVGGIVAACSVGLEDLGCERGGGLSDNDVVETLDARRCLARTCDVDGVGAGLDIGETARYGSAVSSLVDDVVGGAVEDVPLVGWVGQNTTVSVFAFPQVKVATVASLSLDDKTIPVLSPPPTWLLLLVPSQARLSSQRR